MAIAANGDIYVADGHGGNSNDRIVKFSKDGKFIKAWGKHGKAQGEFDTPHGIAVDSAGNLYVADRVNSRVQVFDGDGKFLTEWKQFGRPSSVSIDKNDVIYVADFAVDREDQPGLQDGNPHRQREGRQGHRLHSGNPRARRAGVDLGGRRRASSTPASPTRWS